ncbi:response regulator transcription factor [Dyella sp. 2RAB6]|uniref:response regulator transcription factor n=1 Tax=Dyella sp. 2RAB6 TaxID=3232992 RepID=UPI003F938BA4
MLLLLVEDDRDLAASVLEYLESDGYECDHAPDGKAALELLQAQAYAAIVLDVNLPRMDGFALCKAMREAGVATPCLMLTARDSLADKLNGFRSGTDDYLVKPFDMAELSARLGALSQRGRHLQRLAVADLAIDLATRTAARHGRPLSLSGREWQVLVHLARKSPEVVTREQLEDLLWPNGAPSADALKMVLYRLRNVVDDGEAQALVHTIRGHGVALRAQAPQP